MKISEYLDNFKKILIQNEQKLFYSLIFFGLILRLVNLFNSAISADSLDYINIGKNIRENQSFSLDYRFFFFDGNFSTYHDSFQRAPLYSLLISPIASFSNIRLISFLNVIFFYSFLYIFYDLVCSNFDKRVAQLSCIALSIHPLFVEITSIPSSEPLFMLLVVLSLRNINSHNPRDVILHSIFVGLAYLTRPLALTVLVSSLLIKSINRQYRESSYTLFFFLVK